ncbi:hypothetical protein D6C85_08124 [Aureobasidium pullulans]|uniref:Uncharacterized protein n=1 Tax=Aureobasidium pullulans TaxID=5580 RepID=A0A4S9WLK0_AURPU|nr:hypothetical protein D6C85_08124 [Aureobasidium pullulans]TIA22099.1 hypothetical protein D6C81_03490 [Aureobasidium pullulans]
MLRRFSFSMTFGLVIFEHLTVSGTVPSSFWMCQATLSATCVDLPARPRAPFYSWVGTVVMWLALSGPRLRFPCQVISHSRSWILASHLLVLVLDSQSTIRSQKKQRGYL